MPVASHVDVESWIQENGENKRLAASYTVVTVLCECQCVCGAHSSGADPDNCQPACNSGDHLRTRETCRQEDAVVVFYHFWEQHAFDNVITRPARDLRSRTSQ